jgi:ketosteroid isomerase-like protein
MQRYGAAEASARRKPNRVNNKISSQKTKTKMKSIKLFSALAIIIALFSAPLLCQAQTVMHPNAESNVKTVRDAQSAFLKGDWAALQALLAPNAKAYQVAGRDSLTGPELIQYWRTDRESGATVALGKGLFLPLNMPDGPQKGDWVFEWNQQAITNKAGKKAVFPYHAVFKIKDGKIEMILFYYDAASIMKQQGWTLTPPGK